METLSNFFEWINKMLGVSSGGELVFHPVFIGFCLIIFIYAILTGMKYIALPIGALMGGGTIWHYLYPQEGGLGDLVQFIAAMCVMGLVLVYIGFIRE
jgi:hypothetical protein